jgi:hypothetical protein
MAYAAVFMAGDIVHTRLVKFDSGFINVAIYSHHVHILSAILKPCTTSLEVRRNPLHSFWNIDFRRLKLPH